MQDRCFRKLRSHWDRTDTIVIGTNVAALALFVANTWWGSAWVCTVASAAPIAIQLAQARAVTDSLRGALAFGACIGAAWPIGEGIVTRAFGWWGQYLAPGPVVWYTPLYCILIGWLASAHIYYVARRTREMGFGRAAAIVVTCGTAAVLGVVGENLFVAAKMWSYYPSNQDWIAVPAFVPIAYGVGYGVLPFIPRWRAAPAAAAVASLLLVVAVGLGLVTGFFPRGAAGH